MNRTESIIASIGLAIGALFGALGSIFVNPPVVQAVLYEISSVGLVTATAFLAVKYVRTNHDFLATGFLIFAIGEAIMTVGTAGDGMSAFGAGLALYVPALFFISIPKYFPIVFRISGIAAAIPFAITASKIFHGEQVSSTSTLPGIGYGLLIISIIGWIWTLLKRK